MLDKTIHRHLDEMDVLRSDIDGEIDSKMKLIDIDELMSSPSEYIEAFVEMIKEDVILKYAERAVALGEKFAKSIEKKDEIIIDESTDPNKNKEIVDDKGRG